jgi:CheY-like chemotaxis protein
MCIVLVQKEVAMKAAGLLNKCTPARTVANLTNEKPPAHVPVRRALTASLQRFAEGAPRKQPGPAAANGRPLDLVVLHGAPDAAPHVLHIDKDPAAALQLAVLLMPEARVTHVPTLAAAREMLRTQIFSAVVLDPDLPDGDAAELLPALATTPLLVYSASPPSWRGHSGVFLPKPWTPPRLLWITICKLLSIPTITSAGD